jgi:hypothetical protein
MLFLKMVFENLYCIHPAQDGAQDVGYYENVDPIEVGEFFY